MLRVLRGGRPAAGRVNDTGGLDLDTMAWAAPALTGRPPCARSQRPPSTSGAAHSLHAFPTATPQWRRSTAAAHAASDGGPGA